MKWKFYACYADLAFVSRVFASYGSKSSSMKIIDMNRTHMNRRVHIPAFER